MGCTMLDDRRVRSAKIHRCSLCGKPIALGSSYQRRTYIMDGDFVDEKLHSWCWGEMRWYFDVTRESELDDWWLAEFVDEELSYYGHTARDRHQD